MVTMTVQILRQKLTKVRDVSLLLHTNCGRTKTVATRTMMLLDTPCFIPPYGPCGAQRSAHSATEPAWIKNAMQQILEMYDVKNQKTNDEVHIKPSSISSALRKAKENSAVSDAELDRALLYFQNRLKEAQLCVSDCNECMDSEELQNELAVAETAIQESVSCLVELLDAVRDAGVTQQERFREIREDAVSAIRDVRNDLNRLKGRSVA